MTPGPAAASMGNLRRVVAASVLLGVGLAAWLYAATAETHVVAFFQRRPRLLHFGAPAAIGPCVVRETDDPASDVLANLLDADGDGRSDFRMMGFIDGSAPSCERRWLGLWVGAETTTCLNAAQSCQARRGQPAK